MPESQGDIPTPIQPDVKPAHHQSIQHVLSDEVVSKIQNSLLNTENVKATADEETVKKFHERVAFIKELREYEKEGLLTTEEAIEIEAAYGIHAEQALEKQLLTDEKSKLFNERGYKLMLARKLSEARRSGEKFLVSYWDLKGFKQVNDQLGHDTGDKVFGIIGILLETELRENDVAARLHGDEFAILFSGGDAEKIKQRWLRIRDNDLPDVVDKALKALGVENRPHVTTSMGFYEVDPSKNESVDEILKKADAAMYENKRDQKSKDIPEAA